MAERQEHQPRRRVGYVGEPVEVRFPAGKDRAARGDFTRVTGELAQRLDALVKSIDVRLKGHGPIKELVGQRLSENWSGMGTASDDELAYVLHGLAERGLQVQWNGSDYILSPADEEDDSDG